jgi:hypothetical protein
MARDKYEEVGEWAYASVHKARTGFVVTRHSRIQGQAAGVKILVPYGADAACGYGPDCDLDAPHNELFRVGDIILDGVLHWGNLEGCRVLRRGHVVR